MRATTVCKFAVLSYFVTNVVGDFVHFQANDLIVKHFLNKEVEGTIICCIDQTLWLDVEEQEIYDG